MTEGPLLPTPPLTHRIPPRTPPQYQTCLMVPGVCPAAPSIVSSLVLTPRGETGHLLEDSSKTFDPKKNFKWPVVSVPCCCRRVNTAAVLQCCSAAVLQCCSAAVINQCQSGATTLLHNSIPQVTAGESTG